VADNRPVDEPQVSVWGLGLGGVNLVKSPLTLDDSELVQAQNAEPYRDRGVAGIRKRPAWRPINSVATSAIQGSVSVELASAGAGNTLASPGTTTDIPASGTKGLVLVARNTHPASAAWKYTVDAGATWATTTALSKNIANSDHSAIVYKGRAFYAGEDDSIGQILCFDGSKEFEFCRLPFGAAVATTGGTNTNAVGMAMGQFIISNNNGTTGQVWMVDPVTGGATLLGGTFTASSEIVTDVCAYAGRVWICTSSVSGSAVSHIYSIRPGIDTAWTTERTTTDMGSSKFLQYNSLAVKDGQLYAATTSPAGFAAKIEKRTAAGVWSTELTSGDTTNLNYYDALTVWNGNLYAQFAGGAVVTVVKQASVGSWSTDKDMAAAGSTSSGYFLVTPDVLFASGAPRVFTKNLAGSWSTSLSDASLTHGLLI
jgi:hypothetical protein